MLISVIIPIFNKEEYLNDCIKSVVNQDYKKIEIILINDGSIDDSENIIKKWSNKDSRIKYIFQENKGVASARNKGISISNGQYIFLLDADDYLVHNALSNLVGYAEHSKSDIVIGNFIEVKGYEVVKKPGFKNKIYNKGNLNQISTILEMFIVEQRHMAKAGNKLYKLDFILEHQVVFQDNVIAEDRLFNLICYLNNPIIQTVNEYTYNYNMLDDSRSRTLNSDFYNENISLIKHLYDYLTEYKKLESNFELFHLIVIYDVHKILNQTFDYSNGNIKLTNSTIKRLRKDPLVYGIISEVIKQRKYDNIKNKKSFNKMLLMNKLLIRSPYLIVFSKILGYLTRGIRIKISKNK